MGTIATVALIVLSISFLVFVTFFGRIPALRNTPIAGLHRILCVHIPNGVLAVDQKLTSGRVSNSCLKFSNYIMFDRHPTVLIFFILLLVVGECLYLPTAWPQLSNFQKFTGAISIVLPYTFLYLAAASDPGYITHQNNAYHLGLYPYDFSIFSPGHECRTCRMLKPARSKHCSICKRCVAKMDHHCIFINGCVGYGNHHWFILLLLSTAILCSYGGFLGFSLLSAKIKGAYPAWKIWKPANMEFKQYLVLWGWSLQDQVGMGSVTLLATMVAPLVWGLLGYTLWLVYCGTTTNESLKWEDWKAEMDDGFAFKRPMPANRPKDTRIEAAWSRWPLEAEQVIIRTEDGRQPHPDQPLPGVGEWERVWKLKDVENIYDLGFWNNLKDVFIVNYTFNSRSHRSFLSGKKRRRA